MIDNVGLRGGGSWWILQQTSEWLFIIFDEAVGEVDQFRTLIDKEHGLWSDREGVLTLLLKLVVDCDRSFIRYWSPDESNRYRKCWRSIRKYRGQRDQARRSIYHDYIHLLVAIIAFFAICGTSTEVWISKERCRETYQISESNRREM